MHGEERKEAQVTPSPLGDWRFSGWPRSEALKLNVFRGTVARRCVWLSSNMAFWMRSSQGVGASVEEWMEQGALLQQFWVHLVISVLMAACITCLTNLSEMGNLRQLFRLYPKLKRKKGTGCVKTDNFSCSILVSRAVSSQEEGISMC